MLLMCNGRAVIVQCAHTRAPPQMLVLVYAHVARTLQAHVHALASQGCVVCS